ncbi:N-acetylmuramoyl-L-alanine amidase [Fibrella sp. HMF5335]|uniref:N-acetylmuramoyl-L-alanine amidase n=1 Tax=Fibrella rubiginis TaxID=2817060 RepID=A0A939GI64_9BACT|nr:N-acetylmuramoyl-L-alanine amidase [Fibrella rubiginis]MBO0937221.1 N-acetylmuramoyl-L-alanine amidase [Fibrella rubiginis]
MARWLVKIVLLLVVLGPLLALTNLPKPVWQDDTATSGQPRPAGRANQIRTVVLDAGHGGHDPGTHGRYAKEKTLNLKIALEIGRKIKEEMPGMRVIYTRTTDRFIELAERSAIANRNRADLFISIHCNANPNSKAVHGTETYTMGLHKTEGNLDVAKRENAVILKETNYQETYKGFNPNSPLAYIMLANYQHAFLGSSINFAEKVERNFRRNAERRSNGVKQAGFLVLWRTTMPSVLVETGYLTNADEEDFLASDQGRDRITSAVYKAFEQYKHDMEGE